jgi:hypothetical protein
MAADFYRLGNVSMIDLLKSSGYVQDPFAVMEPQMEEVFQAYPNLIDDWVRLCEDKRTPEGWYLLRSHYSAGWTVGRKPETTERRRFTDQFKACAFFVKQEVEQYRAHIRE